MAPVQHFLVQHFLPAPRDISTPLGGWPDGGWDERMDHIMANDPDAAMPHVTPARPLPFTSHSRSRAALDTSRRLWESQRESLPMPSMERRPATHAAARCSSREGSFLAAGGLEAVGHSARRRRNTHEGL